MGLEEVGVKLVVEGDKQYAAAMKAAQGTNSGFSDSVNETGTQSSKAADGVDKLSKSAKTGAGGFSTFGAAVVVFNQGLELVNKVFDVSKQVIEQTVGQLVKYGAQVRELGRTSGASAEDTSRLIQMADDLGIEFDSLTTAARKAAKDGISFTSDAMANLSDEYLAIQDPAARATFLMDNFGKSGTAIAAMMAEGGAAIRARSAAIEDSMILTEQDIKNTRDMEIATDDFNDAIQAITLSIGKDLLPKVVEFLKQGKEFVDWIGSVKKQAQITTDFVPKLTDVIIQHGKEVQKNSATYEDYVTEMKRAAGAGGLIVTMNGSLMTMLGGVAAENVVVTKSFYDANKGSIEFNDSVKALVASEDGWVSVNDRSTAALDLVSLAIIANTGSAGDMARAEAFAAQQAGILQYAKDAEKTSIDILTKSMGELTDQIIYQAASEGMSADQKLRLAQTMGLVNERSLEYLNAVQALKGLMESGYMTVEEYNKRVAALADSYDRLTSKDITITTKFVEYHSSYSGANRPNANGGQWMIGPGYANEGYRFPDGRTASSGEIVTVTPAPPSYSQVSAGPSSYNYNNSYAYNLSMMTSQSPQVVQRSFAMMQLLAGGR